MTTYFSEFESPVGQICLQGDGHFLTGLYMPSHKHWSGIDVAWERSDDLFTDVRDQLAEYFAGERQQFDLPFQLHGTPFQQRVWQELTRIPFGTTITYGQLAERIHQPTASRAVGLANGRNPVSIIVPCHRVIGADGKLTGYGGGIRNKDWLLAWERQQAGGSQSLFDTLVFCDS